MFNCSRTNKFFLEFVLDFFLKHCTAIKSTNKKSGRNQLLRKTFLSSKTDRKDPRWAQNRVFLSIHYFLVEETWHKRAPDFRFSCTNTISGKVWFITHGPKCYCQIKLHNCFYHKYIWKEFSNIFDFLHGDIN